MNNHRILVVDDEEDLCEILQFNLENEGYIVDVSHSGEDVLNRELSKYDLILLDVMMEGISGYKVAKALRNAPTTSNLPIIFITAKDSENDILTGFSIGAEDYIKKPFSIKEVLARVQVALRRNHSKRSVSQIIKYKKLNIDVAQKKVLINNTPVELTKKEFEILHLLLGNQNYVFSREEILAQVWEEDVLVLDRTIDVNITRLRKKITPYGNNIVTRLGYGYCFENK